MANYTFFITLIAWLAIAQASIIEPRAETGEALKLYGYNPPRVNPEYCVGFHIDYPTSMGLAFEANSLQALHWSVDGDIPHSPNFITRIRILNSTQHNQYVIGEDVSLYQNENHGWAYFPLGVKDVTGIYHYRIMVNYPGTTTHCVYESVPFMIIQDPSKKYQAAGPPVPDSIIGEVYTALPKSQLDLPSITKIL